MKCRACGYEHGTLTCSVARARREHEARKLVDPADVWHDGEGFVVVANAPKVANSVVANAAPVVANKESRHGKYADAESRKVYQRELMRKRRAEGLA